MQLSSILDKDCTKAAVLFNSKKRLLEYLSQLAHAKLPHVSQNTILNAVLSREKLGSTGIGQGIAIPHGRLAELTDTLAIVIVNREAINYDAIDNRPVDIFVAFFIPDDQAEQHLKLLAKIADKLSNKQFCKQLRMAKTDDELYQIIVQSA